MVKDIQKYFFILLFLSSFLNGCCSKEPGSEEKIRLLEASLNTVINERNKLREENDLMKKDVDWAIKNRIPLPSTRPNYSENFGGRFREVFDDQEVDAPKEKQDAPVESHSVPNLQSGPKRYDNRYDAPDVN